MGERTYYLDHAAATPCDPRVVSAMEPYLSGVFYNPSASYTGGREAKKALETARGTIAGIIGAKPNDIIFTAGATESINLAVQGVLASGGKAVISAVEHVAVRKAVENYPHAIAAVDTTGRIDLADMERQIDDETVLVSVVLADNEFGAVQPLSDVARILERIREDRRVRGITMPLYFYTDASQGQTILDLSVSRLGVDMMTLNSGKCYGPKQMGALWLKPSVQIKPFIVGGGQERGLRGGTENVAEAVGFATALGFVQADRHGEAERLREIKRRLMGELIDRVPDIVFDGHPKRSLPGHIHMHVDGLDAERVVFHLDNEGIYIATGAACSANKETRLPSLEAIGLTESEADGSLRITLGHLNDVNDVPYLAEKIANAIQTERNL